MLSVCETPAAIGNGNLNILEDGFRATYNCSLGYVIKGDTERQCVRDGSGWTGAAPICGTIKSFKLRRNGGLLILTSLVTKCGILTSVDSD